MDIFINNPKFTLNEGYDKGIYIYVIKRADFMFISLSLKSNMNLEHISLEILYDYVY